MQIRKEESQFGLQIFIEEGNSCLSICFGGNLDLYWSINSNKRATGNDTKMDSFVITKENYELYSLFETLYNDIKEINIFEDFKGDKDKYRLYNRSNYQELFDEKSKTITWYSDETAHEVANYLKIKKEEDCFIIDFHIQEYIDGCDRDFSSLYYIPIRFRNSGSRYDPFNVIFMRMYDRLKSVEDIHEHGHQIHMEEYLYNLKHQKALTKTFNKNTNKKC